MAKKGVGGGFILHLGVVLYPRPFWAATEHLRLFNFFVLQSSTGRFCGTTVLCHHKAERVYVLHGAVGDFVLALCSK